MRIKDLFLREKEYYCVCEEKINGKWSGSISIRLERDCSPNRFRILGKYDNFQQAEAACYFFLN